MLRFIACCVCADAAGGCNYISEAPAMNLTECCSQHQYYSGHFFVSFIAKFAISVVHDMQQRLSNAYVHGQVWMLSCMGVWVCTPVLVFLFQPCPVFVSCSY